jgi:NADPH:quinone reductase-like Zn-dependent oxidoreductase
MRHPSDRLPESTGPAADEVLVGVEWAPINMNDLYVIQGAFSGSTFASQYPRQ